MTKILKFREIYENVRDTPESYISQALKKIKKKIDDMFKNEAEASGGGEIKRFDKSDKKDLSFGDLGLQLLSSEESKYSKIQDSLTIKFSDEEFMYSLYIGINLKNAVPEDNAQEEEKDYNVKDIKKCYIKFKKYKTEDMSLVGEINKNVDIDKIDQKFLIDIKLELDEEFGDDNEDFEIVVDKK